MNKIVVTGALGHIGSRLIRTLPASFPDAELVLIDNFATQRYASLFDLPESHYRFVEADVCDSDLEPLLEGSDGVVHLAALTDAAASFGRREEVERVNLEATVRVANACAATNTPFLHLSSTSVYGTQNQIVDEDCTPDELKPQSPYAETKLREEEVVAELGSQKGLKYVVCRFGTIFGTSPGMRFHTAVNKFCWQAVMGLPLTVWTTAYDQKRPYLDLGDAIRAIAHILDKNLFDNRTYNVLTQNATVHEIINVVRRYVQSIDITFVDSEIMNQLSYEVSCERFRSTGFTFTGSIDNGIRDTVQLLRQAGQGARTLS